MWKLYCTSLAKVTVLLIGIFLVLSSAFAQDGTNGGSEDDCGGEVFPVPGGGGGVFPVPGGGAGGVNNSSTISYAWSYL